MIKLLQRGLSVFTVFSCMQVIASTSLSEDFETFELGELSGQMGWSSDNQNSVIASSGNPDFGARSIRHTLTLDDVFFDLRSPEFATPYGEGLFMDITIVGEDPLRIIPWDLGGGIQNTILSLNTDGSMSVSQLSTTGTFLSVTAESTGQWSDGVTTRIGFVVGDSRELTIYQDGEVIFEGIDMAQAYPFGNGVDAGIGQLRFEKGVDFPFGGTQFFIDNIGPDMLSPALDADSDGVADALDNCTLVSNPDQLDTDADGYGNLCDPDLNNDGIVNFLDLNIFSSLFLSQNADADFNGDGLVNFSDLFVLSALFLAAPGPSGINPVH